MTLRVTAFATLFCVLAGPALAQSDDAFGVRVTRGPADDGGIESVTEIDPSGLSAPVTIVRGRVRAAPPPPPAAAPSPAPTVTVFAGYPYRTLYRYGLWSVPGRPIQHVWYSWQRGFQLGLARDLLRGRTH